MKVKCEYPRCGRSFKNIHARSVHQDKAHSVLIPAKARIDAGLKHIATLSGVGKFHDLTQEAHSPLNGELGSLVTIVSLYKDLSAISQRWLRERIAVEG